MRNKLSLFVLSSTIFFLSFVIIPPSQSCAKSTFVVHGNCFMCKELIEEASHSIDGVNYADWNLISKLITINYDNTITCLDSIHFAISKIGYKTDKLPATKKGYKSLPFCCKVSGACKPLKTK